MNILSAIGNVGKDAEVRYTASNDAILSFSFALTSGYGEKQVTTWLNCNLWGKRAETLAPMLLKGTKIGITGEITNRPYKDKQGNDKYSLECRVIDITLLSKVSESSDKPKTEAKGMSEKDFDDAIPF